MEGVLRSKFDLDDVHELYINFVQTGEYFGYAVVTADLNNDE